MHQDPDKFAADLAARLPSGLTESDLLDWVEADARARAAAEPGSSLHAVDRAIAADPSLGRWLEALRIDRAALGSLETPAPPAWVAQAVLDEHERQALLSLSDLAARAPRSAMDGQGDESFSFSAMPRWFKPALAVAALLTLAFGAWQLLPFVLPKPTPGPIVASDPQGPTPQDPAQAEDANPAAPDPLAPLEAAPRLAQEDAPAFPVLPTPRIIKPSARDMLASRLETPVDDALELALQGRLMIVVETPDAAAAGDAALAIAAQPTSAAWTLAEPTGRLLAAMSTPDHARFIGIDPASEGPAIATDRGPLGQLEIVLASTPTVYLAPMSASPEAMLSLLVGLERLGGSCRVVVLDKALPDAGTMPAPLTAPMSADVLLWWEADAAAWQPWTAIPVRFVEPR